MAALMSALSCSRDEAGLNPPQPQTVTITAGTGQTKTLLSGGAVKWEKGDEIALAFSHDVKGCTVGKFSTSIETAAPSADFTGQLPLSVTSATSGYEENVYAVYPGTAVTDAGKVDFTLPSEQRVRADGTFAAGHNLTSALVSLEDIRDDGNASATFRNALSILRFSLKDDVTSVKLTGTAPLAGTAPFKFDSDTRLVVDTEAEWAEADKNFSVTLLPAEGSECFAAGEVNLLVLPGTHSSMTVTLNFKEYGEYTKSSAQEFTFAPSKFYTLDFNADSETLVAELDGSLTDLEGALDDAEDKLDGMESDAEAIAALLKQIQSVALMTEYLDNSVYAIYSQVSSYQRLKVDIELDYIVRPAAVAKELVEKHADAMSEVMCAQVYDKNGSFTTLPVVRAEMNGDVMTVTVDAENLPTAFYSGTTSAELALEISDGNTQILSEFATLVPKVGTVVNFVETEDLPVMRGATMLIPFKHGMIDASAYTLEITSSGFPEDRKPALVSNNGYVSAHFLESDDLSKMSVTVTLASGGETSAATLTFADGGSFDVTTSGDVDYIGGEVSLEVTSNSFGSYSLTVNCPDAWLTETYSGVSGRYTVEKNSGAERSCSAVYSIGAASVGTYGDIRYTKSVTILQKADGTAIDESKYYSDGNSLTLQSATASGMTAPLNIVIVGDGYMKKDLQKGGKFERAARSAMDAFFGVEPYKSFRDRFRVVMVAYESEEEGLSIENGTQKDTYFKSYYKASGNTYVNITDSDYTAVENVVRNDLGWSDNATYYRTIVLMLINTTEGIGSNAASYRAAYSGSDLGEPYASFAIAMVTANNTETSNLIRHEAGGHAFGRLGDEYPDKKWDEDVNNMHSIGWYRNVTVDKTLWNWDEFIGLTGYEDVTYYQPNSTYYCPIDHTEYSSIMYNNTGKFNAPSRRIIYERIIRQTEGSDAYSWEKFLEYDKRNL